MQRTANKWFNWKGIAVAASLLFAVSNSYGQSKPKAKKIYHKQIVIKAERPKLDSLIAYYTGSKPYVPITTKITVATIIPTTPPQVDRVVCFLGNVVVGTNIENMTATRSAPEIGYFNSVEGLLQVL